VDPSQSFLVGVGSLHSFDSFFGRFGGLFGCSSSFNSWGQASLNQIQLDPKQPYLEKGSTKQKARDDYEPIRVIGEPRGVGGESFFGLSTVLPLAILLLGLRLSIGAGEYLYCQRYFVGAALIGCGCSC
jgi:hypothetical protein